MAAWRTSVSDRSSCSVARVGAPDRMTRLSALRRIREARWSRRNRLSRRCGSSSSLSSVSIRPSCWLISEVLRRDRVTNMSPTWARRLASPDASLTAWRCRSSTARASWPVSSCVVTPIGSISPGSWPARILATASGSRSWATSRAPVRTRRIGPSSSRDTRRARMIAAMQGAADDDGVDPGEHLGVAGRGREVVLDLGQHVVDEDVVGLVARADHLGVAAAGVDHALGVALPDLEDARVGLAERDREPVDRGELDAELGVQLDRVGRDGLGCWRPGSPAARPTGGRRGPGRAPAGRARAGSARR